MQISSNRKTWILGVLKNVRAEEEGSTPRVTLHLNVSLHSYKSYVKLLSNISFVCFSCKHRNFGVREIGSLTLRLLENSSTELWLMFFLFDFCVQIKTDLSLVVLFLAIKFQFVFNFSAEIWVTFQLLCRTNTCAV